MNCGCIHKGDVGRRVLWMKCTEPHNHEGKHFDYVRSFSWEGQVFWHGDFAVEGVAVEGKRVRKERGARITSSEERGNTAVEKSYETRTGQTSFQGKAHMDSIWDRDQEELDAAFRDIAERHKQAQDEEFGIYTGEW